MELHEEAQEISWNVVDLNEVRRIWNIFLQIQDGNILCRKSLAGRKKKLVGFLINKNLGGNVDVFSVVEKWQDLLLNKEKKINQSNRNEILQFYSLASVSSDKEVKMGKQLR